MVFKILGIERAWQGLSDEMPRPRQLFVTQSRVLAEKVEEYFSKMSLSLASAVQTYEELAQLAARKKEEQDRGLVDREEEILQRDDLPQRWSELQDEHFPLFLTFDHVSADR